MSIIYVLEGHERLDGRKPRSGTGFGVRRNGSDKQRVIGSESSSLEETTSSEGRS